MTCFSKSCAVSVCDALSSFQFLLVMRRDTSLVLSTCLVVSFISGILRRNLRFNHLSGPIPSSFAGLTNLKHL